MILSYTLLSTWLMCPHQAARRYIVKDVPAEEAEAIQAGNKKYAELQARIRNDLSQFSRLLVEEKLAMSGR